MRKSGVVHRIQGCLHDDISARVVVIKATSQHNPQRKEQVMFAIKKMSEIQENMINAGAKILSVMFRYEDNGGWGRPARKESIKAMIPNWGEGIPFIESQNKMYFFPNDGNIYSAHISRKIHDNEIHVLFSMREGDHKRTIVVCDYNMNYVDSCIINGYVARPVRELYAVMDIDGSISVIEHPARSFNPETAGYVISPQVGQWYAPLAYADMLAESWNKYVSKYAPLKPKASKGFEIPESEDVQEALKYDAKFHVAHGIESGVYIPTAEEIQAAIDIWAYMESTRYRSHGETVSVGWAKKMADACDRFVKAQENAIATIA